MPATPTVRVDAADARARARAALAAFDPADADLAARAVVAGEASGWPEFGLALLVRELRDVRGRGVAVLPDRHGAPPVVVTGAAATLDAQDVPGPIALAAAVRRAAGLARELGVGVVTVRHAGGTGRLGAYVRALADDGLVGVTFAQSPPTVAPYGGTAPVVGTNPVAVAVPRAGQGHALVVDAATSAVTLADARRHAREGAPLPDGSALGPDGTPTRDASAIGALLPAGLLGSLLGLTAEALAGLLTGARGDALGRGLWVLALDPRAFGADDLGDRADRLCDDWLRAGGHVPGARPDPEALDVDRDVWDALDPATGGMP